MESIRSRSVHKSSSPTDLHCYFGCDEAFKKDFQLNLHLRLKHKHAEPEALNRAFQAAEDEIAFTRRSGSTFQCALCGKIMYSADCFYGHTKSKHNLIWQEYKKIYGRCEIESTPFECKICGRVIKWTNTVVHNHLKAVHGLKWVQYLDRIRKMTKGDTPDELPTIEVYQCQVCNVTVKGIKNHLWDVHRLTEEEYADRLRSLSRGEAPEALPAIETFICRLCGVTVKYLKNHLKSTHKITEAEYEELFQQ
jgi:hypothetical protein